MLVIKKPSVNIFRALTVAGVFMIGFLGSVGFLHLWNQKKDPVSNIATGVKVDSADNTEAAENKPNTDDRSHDNGNGEGQNDTGSGGTPYVSQPAEEYTPTQKNAAPSAQPVSGPIIEKTDPINNQKHPENTEAQPTEKTESLLNIVPGTPPEVKIGL